MVFIWILDGPAKGGVKLMFILMFSFVGRVKVLGLMFIHGCVVSSFICSGVFAWFFMVKLVVCVLPAMVRLQVFDSFSGCLGILWRVFVVCNPMNASKTVVVSIRVGFQRSVDVAKTVVKLRLIVFSWLVAFLPVPWKVVVWVGEYDFKVSSSRGNVGMISRNA